MINTEEQILNRFNIFFNLLDISKLDFGFKLNLSKQNVNRLFENLNTLNKYYSNLSELGCNLNWLCTGQGTVILKNSNGIKIIENNACLDDEGYLVSEVIKKRVVNWIMFNYDSLENFYNQTLNNHIIVLIDNLYDCEYIVPLELMDLLDEYGCNLKWVLRKNNEKNINPYSSNNNGKTLKIEKGKKENYLNLVNFSIENN